MRSPSRRAAVLAALVVLSSGAALRGDDVAAVPRIGLADFKAQHDRDKLLVIDVRSADAYRNGHIAGAVSVPLSAWAQNLPRLKASKKPIVAYCA
jgi:3-mercaptopyruvate sulfurtransferase SseA